MTSLPVEPLPQVNWDSPEWAEKKELFKKEFESTRLAFLAKVDDVARFVSAGPEDYSITRGLLLSRAYTDVWGIPGQCAILNTFVLKDPSDNAQWTKAMNLAGPGIQWAIDLGNEVLLDTGIVLLSEFFSQRNEGLEKELALLLPSHPKAEIQLIKAEAYIGITGSPRWNHEGLANFLRALLSDTSSAPSSLH